LRAFRALAAEKHLATFEKLIAFVRGSDERTIDAELLGDVASGRSTLKTLDERHFDSPDVVSDLDEWLRALECVRVVSLEDFVRIKEQRARLNPLREQRLAARELALREARVAAERVIAILCESADLGGAFVENAGERMPMRRVSASAPDWPAFAMRVMTRGGRHHAFFYETPALPGNELRAELWNDGAPRAIATTTLARAVYTKIVPDYLSRRALARLSAWQLSQ
jgi:hypothetical protein